MSDSPNHPQQEASAQAPRPVISAIGPAEAEEARTQALAEALKSSFVLVKFAMVFLAVAFLCSGIFTVKPQERALILRFGKPVGEGEAALLGPGLHWAFPYPVDDPIKIPAVLIQQANSTVGWYAVDPKLAAAGMEPPAGPSLNPVADGYTLTGDGNIIHVRATIRYRVTEPLKYYLRFTNAAEFVTNALNNAILYASAQYTVDNALRRDLAGFKERVISRVNDLVAQQQLGITLEPSDITTIPPRQVKAAFEEVLAAENERSKTINDAQGYANEVLSRAKGEGTARVNAGQTDRARAVAGINAEARYFEDLLPQYKKNEVLFTSRLQAETLGRVLTNAQDKFFLPQRADGKPRELRLQLGREPLKSKLIEAPKQDGRGH
ncbi:MAG: protease modulator HflK [Verrucomicrobiota bacterium]